MDIEFKNFLSLQNNVDLISKLNTNQCNFNKIIEQYNDLEGKHYVFVTGILNSGKSSLCNMLIDDRTDSTFKTGDRRVTTKIQKYTDTVIGATYIDTPGLDANKNDDEEAKKSLCIANLIIFVCSMASGSLGDNKEQINYLKNIISNIPDISKRIAFVCTKFVINDKYEEPYEKTKKQLYKIFKKEVPVFLVDNQLYLEGIKYDDSSLKDESGILKLKEWIKNNILIESPYYTVLNNSKKQYINTLYEAQKTIENSLKNLESKKKSIICAITYSWENFKSRLDCMYNLCKKYI